MERGTVASLKSMEIAIDKAKTNTVGIVGPTIVAMPDEWMITRLAPLQKE